MFNFAFLSIRKQAQVRVTYMPDRLKHNIIALVENPEDSYVNAVLCSNGKAYIGYPPLDDLYEEYQTNGLNLYHCTKIQTPQQVSRGGNLLTQQEAEKIFGDIRS